jgi:cell division protein FtsB
MRPSLKDRREKIVRKLEQVNRQIEAVEKDLQKIAARRAALARNTREAA